MTGVWGRYYRFLKIKIWMRGDSQPWNGDITRSPRLQSLSE